MADNEVNAVTTRMSKLVEDLGDATKWTTEQVLVWTAGINLDEASVDKLKEANISGAQLIEMNREKIKQIGITEPLSQSRLLGHIHLLNEEREADDEPEESDADESPRMRAFSVVGKKTPLDEDVRKLKARVWDLFCSDDVASKTNRLFIEGDLLKHSGTKGVDKRRFLLLDSSFLWCSVLKRADGDSMENDRLLIKGRLDLNEFSVLDLPDGTKQGRKPLKNAIKIFNLHKEKWYALVMANADEKVKWLQAFKDAGVFIERTKLFVPQTDAQRADEMLLSDAERMKLMSAVRDGKMSVDDALSTAQESEAIALEQKKKEEEEAKIAAAEAAKNAAAEAKASAEASKDAAKMDADDIAAEVAASVRDADDTSSDKKEGADEASEVAASDDKPDGEKEKEAEKEAESKPEDEDKAKDKEATQEAIEEAKDQEAKE